jgi:single-stranded-DNA-specific exonuclease
MDMRETIWIMNPVSAEAKSLAADLDIPIEVAQILHNRGIREAEDAHKFLFASFDDLYDPFLMRDMKKAVERILKAISSREKILVFGDYDVDGILSVVSLCKALESIGADVDFFIPDRLKEGYGLKEKYVAVTLERKARLVISVDCGIKAVLFAKKAKMAGIDVIITDHHQPGTCLPEALAVLNPALPDACYPYRKLAGVGVVFKLIHALFQVKAKVSLLPHYLKLVSIGTVADIAELRDENRIFVKLGLKGLEGVKNLGLMSLMDRCGLSGKKVTVGDVGFRIGPRINAAGRMGLTDLAVRLFFSDSSEEVKDITHRLDKLNAKRQRIEEKVFSQAKNRIEKGKLDRRYKILILGNKDWHRGVIGIVASKIKDLFYRPVILFTYEGKRAYGSGRSVPDFSLIECLENHQEMFLSYGGHTMAIGCELLLQNMSAFKLAINDFVASRLSDDLLKKKLYIDTKIDFNDISFDLFENISLLSPFGLGNPKPLFLTEKAEIVSQPEKIHQRHSKFLLRQNGRVFEALGWGRGDWAEVFSAGNRVDLIYSLQISEYLGEEKISLSIQDIRQT